MAPCNLPLALRSIDLCDFADVTTSGKTEFSTRVGFLANEYLNGHRLFILSAGLRGPFDHNWRNPWLKETEDNAETELETSQDAQHARLSPNVKTYSAPDNNNQRGPLEPLCVNVKPCNLIPRENDLQRVESPKTLTPSNLPISSHSIILNENKFVPSNNSHLDTKDYSHLQAKSTLLTRHADTQRVYLSDPGSSSQPPSFKTQMVQRAVSAVAAIPPACSTCGHSSSTSVRGRRKSKRGRGPHCDGCGRTLKPNSEPHQLQQKGPARESTKHPGGLEVERANLVTPSQRTGSSGTIRLKPLSQPELSARSSRSEKSTAFEATNSFPRGNDRQVLDPKSIMKRMWPGGLIADFYNVHRQLVNLLDEEGEIELLDRLQGSPSGPLPKALSQPALEHKSPKRGKSEHGSQESDFVSSGPQPQKKKPKSNKREMTFDTPVVTKHRNPLHQQAKIITNEAQSQSRPKADLTIVPSQLAMQNASHRPTKNKTQSSGAKLAASPMQKHSNGLSDHLSQVSAQMASQPDLIAYDSSRLSTPAAVRAAHLAFQHCIDTPATVKTAEPKLANASPKATIKTPGSNNPSKTSRYSSFQQSPMSKRSSGILPDGDSTTEVNTQALFDAYKSSSLFTPTQVLHSKQGPTSPSSIRKQPRFDVALGRRQGHELSLKVPKSTPAPLSLQHESLRKSALKSSTLARARNSAESLNVRLSFGDVPASDSPGLSHVGHVDEGDGDGDSDDEIEVLDSVSSGSTEELDLEALMADVQEVLAVKL